MRVGRKMREAVTYVAAHPYCSKRAVALAIGPSQKYGYATVDRAISAGLIKAQYNRSKSAYELWVPEGETSS